MCLDDLFIELIPFLIQVYKSDRALDEIDAKYTDQWLLIAINNCLGAEAYLLKCQYKTG